jgi:hypothetical protein
LSWQQFGHPSAHWQLSAINHWGGGTTSAKMPVNTKKMQINDQPYFLDNRSAPKRALITISLPPKKPQHPYGRNNKS